MDHISRSNSDGSVDSDPNLLTPRTDMDVLIGEELSIPWSLIARGLDGVAVATKANPPETERIKIVMNDHWSTSEDEQSRAPPLSSSSCQESLSFRAWYAYVQALSLDEPSLHRANLAIVLAFLCHSGRQNLDVGAADLDLVWYIVRSAFSCVQIPYTVARSPGGFFNVPLWSIIKNGNIDELFRFHVWLPDGQRGVPNMTVHAHQPFAQSWILAGQGKDNHFEVEPSDATSATHAEYGLTWSNTAGKNCGKTYQTHQKSSTVARTGKLARVLSKTSDIHTRNMTYTIPAGAFHESEVDGNILHATLFLFDSSRGFQKDAPVLGPLDGDPYTQQRNPAGITIAQLVDAVESARIQEILRRDDFEQTHEAI